mgnify:FL=1
MTSAEVDLAVVGAGPAGMTAATTAAAEGLDVVLLDEQPAGGGQIYRAVEAAAGPRGTLLGEDYVQGRHLTEALARSSARHVREAIVWKIEPDGAVAYSAAGRGRELRARFVVLAAGALERPMPIPGWTLPGVMTAGAAQILLKQSGLVPARAVLAGTGPLLYLLAQQLVRAGHPPAALVETQTRADLAAAMPHLPAALAAPHYLAKGAAMLREIRRARVPRYTGATALRVEGERAAEGLSFRAGGRAHRLDAAHVLLHQGVVPNTQATRSLGLDHRWDARQRCFVPVTDAWGRSSLETVYVVGDGAGITGAKAAEHAGCLAGLDAAFRLGRIDASARRAKSLGRRHALNRERAPRAFLDTAYPPARATLAPADEVVVCRCEEVRAGDIRRWAALGCRGPNQTKAYGRAGMGPCQGRYCALTVSEILAEAHGTTPAEVGTYRIRAPLKPITLGELAGLADADDPAAQPEKETTS